MMTKMLAWENMQTVILHFFIQCLEKQELLLIKIRIFGQKHLQLIVGVFGKRKLKKIFKIMKKK